MVLKKAKTQWPCAVPPIILMILDLSLTLFGQSAQYWANHQVTSEMSPIWGFVLSKSPAVFVLGMLLWGLILFGLSVFTPRFLGLFISVTFTIMHSFGASTWLLYKHGFSYWNIFWYYPIVGAMVLIVCWSQFITVLQRKIANQKINSECLKALLCFQPSGYFNRWCIKPGFLSLLKACFLGLLVVRTEVS